ncbi:MAG: hypothetical protein H5T64_10580 [Chloroflexi bacterium]|nr:hypothetical protein [Chloroflexota bacterium]
MKEREPNFEDEKIRAWVKRPKEHDFESLDQDPTIISIDGETEEIYESRAYHFRPSPETVFLLLGMLVERMGEQLAEISAEQVGDWVTDLLENGGIKFLAKRRKEDGRITYILIGISRTSRWLLDRQELVEESNYRQAVEEFEGHPLTKALLSAPAVVTLEEWRRYAEEGPFAGSITEGENGANVKGSPLVLS